MSKTTLTKKVEQALFAATHKMGVYGCFEVSMGFGGNAKERVDYMTLDSKGIFRFYEIKVTKTDFHSGNHNTFLGHYNYYVMPKELAEEVAHEVPADIGIILYKEIYDGYGVCESWKKAGKHTVSKDDADGLKNYLIRSMSRDSERLAKSENAKYIEELKQQLNGLEHEVDYHKRQERDMANAASAAKEKLQNVLDWLYVMNEANAIRWECAPSGAEMLRSMSKADQRRRQHGMFSDEEAARARAMYQRIFGSDKV